MTQEEAICYGTATVGEKGQLVIPVEARKELGIESGDKILIFGSSQNVLALIKADEVSHMMARVTRRSMSLEKIVKPATKPNSKN